MTTEPLVTVILPSYNYAHFLTEAIESVLAQSYKNWELIIIDDGSGDQSLSIAVHFAKLNPKNIRVIDLVKNMGLASVIEKGVKEAKGEFIAFLEADDLWSPDSLSKRLHQIHKNEASLIFSDIDLLGPDTNWKTKVSKDLESMRMKFRRWSEKEIAPSIFYKNFIPTFSCVMSKKSELQKADYSTPWDTQIDHWLWTQIALGGKLIYLPEKLTIKRIHRENYGKVENLSQNESYYKKKTKYQKELIKLLLRVSKKSGKDLETWLKMGKNVHEGIIPRVLFYIESKRLEDFVFWRLIVKIKDFCWSKWS